MEVVRLVEVLGGRLGAAAAAAVVGGLVLDGLALLVEVALGLAAVGARAVGTFLSVAEDEEVVGLLAVATPVGGAVMEVGRVLAVVLGLDVEAAAGFAFARSLLGAALLPLATGFAFLALSAGSTLALVFSSFFSTVFFSAAALVGVPSFTFSGSFSTFFTSSVLGASTFVSGSAFFSDGSTLGSLTDITWGSGVFSSSFMSVWGNFSGALFSTFSGIFS